MAAHKLSSAVSEPSVHRYGSVESTQKIAAGLPIGSVVLADEQTAGRGRLDRRWETPPRTGLLVTYVLEPRPLLVFAAGVAAARACGPDVRLKWPNDLILEDRKLGGVLAELVAGRALVGIGINLTWAPPGAAQLGADRELLLADLNRLIQTWAKEPAGKILAAWRIRSWTLGQIVRVELAGETLEGLAEDVDSDGALIVAGRRILAGDVLRVRPTG